MRLYFSLFGKRLPDLSNQTGGIPMPYLKRYKYSLLYFVAVIGVSVLFNYAPMFVDLGDGASFSLWALVVGFWFVLRDFSQRELRHFVLIPMGLGLSFAVLINPALALATAISSGISELADWALYSLVKQPFHRRILISSLVSCPLDSFMFFAAFDFFHVIPGVSVFNWTSIIAASLSKLVAALIIFWMYRKKQGVLPVETIKVA
jgi:queuosine precursor transporter